MLRISLFLFLFFFFSNQTHSQSWHTDFGDTLSYATVRGLYVADSSLYIAGSLGYYAATDTHLHCAARWHNNKWYDLNMSSCAGSGYSITKYKDWIFLGGYFSALNGINKLSGLARWDGEEWNNPCNGNQAPAVLWVNTLQVFNDTLFAGGRFNSICEGATEYGTGAYDGTNWINIGRINAPDVNVFAFYNNELLAGTNYHGIKKRVPQTTWEHFPGNPGGFVYDITVDTFNNFLYVAGAFTHVSGGSILSYCVAMWDGFQWNSLDKGVEGAMYALAVYRGDLYIGGIGIHAYDGTVINRIARWDGNRWHSLGKGCDAWVRALAVYNDTLIVGGEFKYVDGSLRAVGLAKWYMPESCNYIRPVIHTYEQPYTPQDTFYLFNGQAEVNFYNNNAYADTWEWDFGDGNKAYEKEPVHTYNYPGTYNINISVSHNDCTRTAEKTIKVLLPVDTEIFATDKINFKLYPNPANDDVIIECTVPADVRIPEIKAYTSTGTLLKSTKLKNGYNKLSLPASQWSKGTVIITLYFDNKQILTEKLIVN